MECIDLIGDNSIEESGHLDLTEGVHLIWFIVDLASSDLIMDN